MAKAVASQLGIARLEFDRQMDFKAVSSRNVRVYPSRRAGGSANVEPAASPGAVVEPKHIASNVPENAAKRRERAVIEMVFSVGNLGVILCSAVRLFEA